MTDFKPMEAVKFWKSRVKNTMYQSHAGGLNKDQIKFLQSLVVGDKLVLFMNNDDTINMRKTKDQVIPDGE